RASTQKGRSGTDQQRRGARRPLASTCPTETSQGIVRCGATIGAWRTTCEKPCRTSVDFRGRACEGDSTNKHSSAAFFPSVSALSLPSQGASTSGTTSAIWQRNRVIEREKRASAERGCACNRAFRAPNSPRERARQMLIGSANLECLGRFAVS